MKKLLLTTLFILCSMTSAFASASRSFVSGEGGQYLNMGNVLDVTTQDCSACAWVNYNENSSAGLVVGKKFTSTKTQAGFFLGQGVNDFANAFVSDGTTQQNAAGTTDLDGTWYFTCFTWNSSTDNLYVYVNGSVEGSDLIGTVGSLTNTRNFRVGVSGATGLPLNGLAAYVQFWDSETIGINLQTDAMWQPGIMLGADNLVGFWPVWGDSSEPDLSVNSNTGTVVNATTSTDGPPVFLGGGLPL